MIKRALSLILLFLCYSCSSYRQLTPNEYLNKDFERDGVFLIMKDSTVYEGSNISIGLDTTSFIEKKSKSEVKVLTKEIATYKTVDRWGGALKGGITGFVTPILIWAGFSASYGSGHGGMDEKTAIIVSVSCLTATSIGTLVGMLVGQEYRYKLNHDSTIIAQPELDYER